MALPLLPLGIGALALFLLTQKKDSGYSTAPADGSSPPVKEQAPPAKSWQDMPPALQEQVASALGALGVSPATGELSGSPVSADAIKLATQTAALCESQGFYDIAKELRRLIAKAAPTVPTPAAAAPIKQAAPPGLSPAQVEAIARTITLDRDPKAIAALIVALQKLPASPQRDNLVALAQALLLQLQAAQSTTQTMQQIDQVIKSPGLPQLQQAIQPLPPVAIPIVPPELAAALAAFLPNSPPLSVLPVSAPVALPVPSGVDARVGLKLLTGTRLLQSGFKGDDVRAWQGILKLDGFAIDADGAYGPKTLAATKTWQAQRGLSADGKVGPATRAKIGTLPLQDKAIPSTPSAAPKPSPAPAKLPASSAPPPAAFKLDNFPDPAPKARNLARGMKGEDVKSWQSILKKFGFNMGTFGPNKDGLDGDFGATAEAQTKLFQQRCRDSYGDARITVDGKVGPITRRLVLLVTAQANAAGKAA